MRPVQDHERDGKHHAACPASLGGAPLRHAKGENIPCILPVGFPIIRALNHRGVIDRRFRGPLRPGVSEGRHALHLQSPNSCVGLEPASCKAGPPRGRSS